MLATAKSAVLVGLDAHPVRVEVQVARGVPVFELVGLAEVAVRESRVRVKSALAGVGVDLSEYRLVVNLAPADLKKRGSAFDLAIAVAALAALGAIPAESLGDTVFLGELSLDGRLRPLRGVVAHLVAARARGVEHVIVPLANEADATLVEGLDTSVASSLVDVVAALRRERPLALASANHASPRADIVDDLADVCGQESARRALEIAAAGGHNLLFVGPPGAGKTMLARRLPGILPPLSRNEALDVVAIHSLAGSPPLPGHTFVRPFRAPHHTLSDVALVGGGEQARPGEVSLAHNGVLFLDEISEFRRSALEALRQPLEDGRVMLSRAHWTSTFPARPMLVGATNPCACGRRGDGSGRCSCVPEALRQYRARLSGPLVDRLDLHVVLPPVDVAALEAPGEGEPSETVRRRVEAARAVQRTRCEAKETSALVNAHLSAADVRRVCSVSSEGKSLLASAVRMLGLSARAYGRVLRMARTIADLEGSKEVETAHVAEAIGARVLDREGAADAAFAA